MLTKTLIVSALLVLTVNSASVQVADPAQCSLCKSAVNELRVIWVDKDVKDMTALGITWMCANVPITDCENWVTGKLAQLEDVIEAVDANDLCTLMTACSASKTRADVAKVDDVSPVCQCCHDVFGEYKKVAHDPETANMAKEIGRVICELVEVPLCDSLITHFMELYLVQAQNLDVDATCLWLKACDAVGDVGDVCSECTMIADKILTLLENDEVASFVKAAIKDACTVLPISNCEQTLDEYFDELIALLKSLDGKELCTLLALCG